MGAIPRRPNHRHKAISASGTLLGVKHEDKVITGYHLPTVHTYSEGQKKMDTHQFKIITYQPQYLE